MAVRRIVANIATDRLDAARAFYGDLLGMNIVMDLGWIMTFAADGSMTPQISVAIEGGSGTTSTRPLNRGGQPVGPSPEDADSRVRNRIWPGD
jgi:catechol 2,3-dioxygenase-like lactoylglutathione lyase family enzyme